MKQIKQELPALYLCLKDPQIPWLPKLLAWITIAYALSPIDLIPDFIPILGYVDDMILLPGLIYLTIKCIPEDLLNQKRELAKEMWKDGKSKKWYYALPILLFWLAIILFIIRKIIHHE